MKKLLLFSLLTLLMTGCSFLDSSKGPIDTVTETIELEDHISEGEIEVNFGVGSTKLFFSEDHAVNVTINRGLGSVSAKGFTSEGDNYKTEIEADEVIYVTIKQGIGEIKLETK